MTLFQLSYWLLWILALILIPVSGVLLYLLVELDSQRKREGQGFGNNLIGRSLPKLIGAADETGASQTIEGFPGQIYVILAVSPGCGSCAKLIEEISLAAAHDIAAIKLVILCMGESGKCGEKVRRISAAPVYIVSDKDDSNTDLWLVGFPAALVVDENRTVVDIRHPVTLKGLTAAVSHATISSGESSKAAALGAGTA